MTLTLNCSWPLFLVFTMNLALSFSLIQFEAMLTCCFQLNLSAQSLPDHALAADGLELLAEDSLEEKVVGEVGHIAL